MGPSASQLWPEVVVDDHAVHLAGEQGLDGIGGLAVPVDDTQAGLLNIVSSVNVASGIPLDGRRHR